jgi:hypothetical protein
MHFILLQAYRIYGPYARMISYGENSNSKTIYILGRFDKILKEPCFAWFHWRADYLSCCNSIKMGCYNKNYIHTMNPTIQRGKGAGLCSSEYL